VLQVSTNGTTGYDDGKIACTDTELVIRYYYFPVGTKRIPYSAIREARVVPMRFMGKARIQCSGDFIHWFNFDIKRPRKHTGLVIYLDGRIRPTITPDDSDRVAAELTAHGVNVTSGTERGAV
jgi:hypothetical protein